MEFSERLNDRLTVIHRRDATPTTLDALLLAAFLPSVCGRTCELGAGGGIISLLAAARDKIADGLLLEREPILAALAARNIESNGFSGILRAACADIREYREDGRFDTVLANPPYRRANDGRPAAHPLADAARYERAGTVTDFCLAAARLLHKGGRFYAVFPTRRRDELFAALGAVGLYPHRTVTAYPYVGGAPKIFLTEAGFTEAPLRRERIVLARECGGAPSDAAEALYTHGHLLTEGDEND